MSKKIMLLTLSCLFLLMLPNVKADSLIEGVDTSGTIVRLISFLLGICGSTYLAAGLWRRAEKGSESWKYLSISMIMLIFWNIVMTVGILLNILKVNIADSVNIVRSTEVIDTTLVILNILDPVIEVMVFLILLFGLRKIVKTMREEPWKVFSKEEQDE
ncbi:MAG: hypothetical protein FIB08_06775 [Candidatus Methanoperedens sp.]|nr:hypothetical protein [Candidatus Methanoperedens sp.]